MTMKRCAFLTMENSEGWSIDADLAITPLEALEWTIDTVPWRGAQTDWQCYDAVYIGTPWDYPQDVELFVRLLEQIDQSGPVLVNPLELVHWGFAKTYSRDLEVRGQPSFQVSGARGCRPGGFFRALTSSPATALSSSPL